MRVGVDAFTIRELNLSPYGMLDYIKSMGFEGIQYGNIRSLSQNLDGGELRALRSYADENNLYTHISITCINPFIYKDGFDSLKECLEEEIKAASAGGWHELHTYINGGMERYEHPIPWDRHIDSAILMINRLRPTLERYGSRINIETHVETTFDILRVIEATGQHLTGVCLDTANTLVNAEDPVLAAKRVAPYIQLTHAKDAIVTFSDEGIIRQGKPPGMGNVDFEKILPILGEYCPDLPLSIEDHKWIFTANIFDEAWIQKNPDLTPYELGQFVKLAWDTHKKLDNGDIPSVEEYEKTPYLDELEERLIFGRDYLNGLIKRLGLYS
jgi:sugar phosphate isomerase/epimerase